MLEGEIFRRKADDQSSHDVKPAIGITVTATAWSDALRFQRLQAGVIPFLACFPNPNETSRSQDNHSRCVREMVTIAGFHDK